MRKLLLFLTVALVFSSCAMHSGFLKTDSKTNNTVSRVDWNKAYVDDVAAPSLEWTNSSGFKNPGKERSIDNLKQLDSLRVTAAISSNTISQKQLSSALRREPELIPSSTKKHRSIKPIPEQIIERKKDHRADVFTFFLFVFGLIMGIGVFVIGTLPFINSLRIVGIIATSWIFPVMVYESGEVSIFAWIMYFFGFVGSIVIWSLLLGGI